MKKFLLFIIIFVLIGGTVFAQFYEHFNMSFRRELAEAYYLVGKQYQSIGKKEKGSDFIDMAFNIYPDLNPKSIDPDKRIVKSAPKITGEWKPKYPSIPSGITAENAVKYQFARFLRNFFIENTKGMLDVVDSRIYIPQLGASYSYDQFQSALVDFFKMYDIDQIPPSKQFDLTTMDAHQVSKHMWSASVMLADDAEIDLSQFLNPGKKEQVFFFRLVGNKWKIFSVGEEPEMLNETLHPEEYVKNTIISCLNAFAAKDLPNCVAYFTEPFTDIPNGKTLDNDELGDVFKVFFDEYDFSVLRDVHVTMNISESRELFQENGKIFKAYMNFEGGSSGARLPYWESYKGTFVVFDELEKTWKIRAIF